MFEDTDTKVILFFGALVALVAWVFICSRVNSTADAARRRVGRSSFWRVRSTRAALLGSIKHASSVGKCELETSTIRMTQEDVDRVFEYLITLGYTVFVVPTRAPRNVDSFGNEFTHRWKIKWCDHPPVAVAK